MTPVSDEQARALLGTAVRACHRAGELLVAPRTSALRTTSKLSAHDLVTTMDLEAEQIVVQTILAAHPDSTITAEEGGAYGTGRIHWYVDPIDGTNNFARGVPLFCISVAAVVDGRTVAACIHDPVRGETFTTGAGRIEVDGRPRSPRPPAGGPDVVLTDFPRGGDDPSERELALWARLVREFDVRRIGSTALALAYVADGRAQLAFNIGTWPWDVAAGSALVTAAGGRYQALGVAEHATLAERLAAPVFLAAAANRPVPGWLLDELHACARGRDRTDGVAR